MEGYREEHDRMHPPFSCDQVHPAQGIHHLPDGLHPWEEVYPRTPDGRAVKDIRPAGTEAHGER